MKIISKIQQEPEPKGKRTIRFNVWGNWVGYISGRRWLTFTSEQDAIDWRDKP